MPQTERAALHNTKHRAPCCRKKSVVLEKERRDTQRQENTTITII